TIDEFTLAATGDLTMFGSYTVVPHDPNYPEELQGKPAFVLTVVHIGDIAQAEENLRPLREAHPPPLDLVAPQGLYEFICSMDAYIVSGRQWFDSVELRALSAESVDVLRRGAAALADTGLEGEIVVVPHGRGRNPEI